MPDVLKIKLVQPELSWENKDANLAHLEEMIWQSGSSAADLIVLPEMFSTGFTMNASGLAEAPGLHTEKWMRQIAGQQNAAVTGSYIIRDDGRYFNRLLWVTSEGKEGYYNKRHLFRMAEEHKYYSAGSEKLLVNIKGFNILPLICYDLRFPVWSRNKDLEYEVLIFVANWPEPRIEAWNALLKARAIENHCVCIGVNRIGKDGNGVAYNGQSAVYGPRGEEIIFLGAEEAIETIELDLEYLRSYRRKFPAFQDEDNFEIL